MILLFSSVTKGNRLEKSLLDSSCHHHIDTTAYLNTEETCDDLSKSIALDPRDPFDENTIGKNSCASYFRFFFFLLSRSFFIFFWGFPNINFTMTSKVNNTDTILEVKSININCQNNKLTAHRITGILPYCHLKQISTGDILSTCCMILSGNKQNTMS